MTKQKLLDAVEKLVEEVVVVNGGRVVDREVVVGGKAVKSRVAEGGKFDLNAARGILAFNLLENKGVLTGKVTSSGPSSGVGVGLDGHGPDLVGLGGRGSVSGKGVNGEE